MINSTRNVANTVEGAKALAFAKLAQNPDILKHTLGVVHNCEKLIAQSNMTAKEKELLLIAAYLHDIGWSSELNHTGFYPYDGYKYLLYTGWDLDLCSLVLYQSEANHLPYGDNPEIYSAFKKTLSSSLESIYIILTVADMTTNSKGETVTLQERLIDMKTIHGAYNPLTEHVSGLVMMCASWLKQIQCRVSNVETDHYIYTNY